MSILKNIADDLLQRMEVRPGDYTGEDGFLHCGACHETRIATVNASNGETIVHPRMCACERTAWERREAAAAEKARQEHINTLRSLLPRSIQRMTFAADADPENPYSKACRKYVKDWPRMYREGVGILLSGGVGVGKTFLAGCIANALVDMERRVLFYPVPVLLSRLNVFADEHADVIDELCRANLVILDDLGAERDTETRVELLYTAISEREATGKPTIYTTNLSAESLENVRDLRYKRIYDRVLGMCPIRMEMTGASRRQTAAAEKRNSVYDMLRGVSLDD